MRVALLAHEQFPDNAKTAVGVLRYADHEVCAVLDRERAGRRVAEFLPEVQDAPIVAGMDEVSDVDGVSGVDGLDAIDALVIGIAPIGGGFEESWRSDVRRALEAGCDVISGLHYFLNEDEEFVALAEETGATLRDVRDPPDDLAVSEGVAGGVDAEVILTVGTDCAVGKMTTTCELVAAARERGLSAGFVPTGQTGILIEGAGIPVDRVVSDFAAGAVERMVRERAAEHDYLFVEGQGAIAHPAYSGVTCSILHGAMPDALVLCHAADREAIHGYESVSLPELAEYVALYERLATPVADSEVVAGALDTRSIEGEDDARVAVESYGAAIDAPASDPIRFGVEDILEAVL